LWYVSYIVIHIDIYTCKHIELIKDLKNIAFLFFIMMEPNIVYIVCLKCKHFELNMFLKSNGFSGKNNGSNKQNTVIHIILLISQFIIALKWLIISYNKI